jgi:type II secretory pathway component PulC
VFAPARFARAYFSPFNAREFEASSAATVLDRGLSPWAAPSLPELYASLHVRMMRRVIAPRPVGESTPAAIWPIARPEQLKILVRGAMVLPVSTMRTRRSYALVLACVSCAVLGPSGSHAAAQGGWRGPVGASTQAKSKLPAPARIERLQGRGRTPVRLRAPSVGAPAALGAASAPQQPAQPAVHAQGRCDESMVLVASVAQAPAAEHSVAAIRVGPGVHMLKPGQHLGEYTLAAVETHYAVLRHRTGGACWVGFASARAATAASSAAAEAAPAQPTDQVHCSAGGTCSVPRQFVGEVTANPGAVRGTIIRAETRDNQPYGIVMTKLMDDSPFLALGLQEGDVVRKVDGHEVPSYPAFMDALAAGKDARSVTLSYERQGQQRQVVVLAQ